MLLNSREFKFLRNYRNVYEKMLTSKIVHLKKIWLWPFFGKTHGFYFNQKNVVKNKKLWFSAKQCNIRKNVKK